MPRQLIIEADGGSRGNPGIAAGGAVVIDGESQPVLSSVQLLQLRGCVDALVDQVYDA